ncbi:MAG: hypothetical protein RIR97_1347 [Pseudomonadota bacterium]
MSNDFGEKLRRRRTEKGLTLDRLAVIVGSTKAYIWQLENKKPAKPSGELLIKIAKALDISAEFLIDDSLDEPSDVQVLIALARQRVSSGLSQKDLDKLFVDIDTIRDGKAKQ